MAIFWVATTGSDSNDGLTEGNAKATFAAGIALLQAGSAGDELRIKGGTYQPTGTNYDGVTLSSGGSSGSPKKIRGWKSDGSGPATGYNEKPVIDGINYAGDGGDSACLTIQTSWVDIEDIAFTRWSTGGSFNEGALKFYGTSTNINVTRVKSYANICTGIGSQSNNVYDITLTDCDSFLNVAASPGNDDGFQFSFNSNSTGTITFIRCRAWLNGDDGFDFFNNQAGVVLEDCWAAYNAMDADLTTYNGSGNGTGFKLGGNSTDGERTLTRLLAFGNYTSGFDNNECEGPIDVNRCTGYNNNQGDQSNIEDFMFDSGTLTAGSTITNCVSYAGGNSNPFVGQANLSSSTNSWTNPPNITVASSDFKSLSSTGYDGARGDDGSLPVLDFLKPSAGSQLIGAGSSGTTLGAFDYTPTGIPTAIYRGSTQIIRVYRGSTLVWGDPPVSLGTLTLLGDAYGVSASSNTLTYDTSISPTAGALVIIAITVRGSAQVTVSSLTPNFGVATSFTQAVTGGNTLEGSQYVNTFIWTGVADGAPGSGAPSFTLSNNTNQRYMAIWEITGGSIYATAGATAGSGTALEATFDQTITGADTAIVGVFGENNGDSTPVWDHLSHISNSPYQASTSLWSAFGSLRSSTGPTTTGVSSVASIRGKSLAMVAIRG